MSDRSHWPSGAVAAAWRANRLGARKSADQHATFSTSWRTVPFWIVIHL